MRIYVRIIAATCGLCFLVSTNATASQNYISPAVGAEKNAMPKIENADYRQKRALIIAIGQYAAEGEYPQITPKTRSWASISSKNDVPVVQKALNNQGFLNENIAVIINKEATKAGIIAAIHEQLINKSRPGDIVVLHYSGHGQQIKDDNGDELDGYDEALVPYDAAVKFQDKVYEGENHLRDDEIEKLVDELRTKLGPSGHLLFVLDACHSGTATRGIAQARGTQEKLAPESYTGTTKSDQESWNESSTKDSERSSFVLFSGASANQLNYEYEFNGQSMGSLTYAFYQTLTSCGETGTYQGLFDQVRNVMASIAPRQMPQVEGNTNAKVLNGELITLKSYQSVKEVIDPKNIVISGGKLLSLFEGSIVTFYPIDKDTTGQKPLATGKIIKSYELESDVLLDKACDKDLIMKSWGYVTEKSFGDMVIKVKLDINRNKEFEKALKSHLDTLGLVDVVQSNPDLLIEVNNVFTASRGNNALQIISSQDFSVMSTVLSDNDVAGDLKKIDLALISFAQARYLRGMNISADNMSARLEIIPVTVENAGRVKIVKERLDVANFMKDSVVHLPEGQHVVLKLTNTSLSDIYFTVFDVMPDNSVGPVFPTKGRKPEEFRLEAGKSIELSSYEYIFEISPPLGLDVFKIILTKQPVDLSGLIISRGEGTRGKSSSPLETLFKNSYRIDTKNRGPKSSTIPVEQVTIQSLPYYIVAKPAN